MSFKEMSFFNTRPRYSPQFFRVLVWLSRDPIEINGGLNEVGFVSNDTINKWDLLGLDSGWGMHMAGQTGLNEPCYYERTSWYFSKGITGEPRPRIREKR